LQSDEDWRDLISIWECDGGKIPIYLPALSIPTMYHFIFQQLQPIQVALTMQPVEPVVAPSINECGNDFGTIEMEEYEEIVCIRQAKKLANSLIITQIVSQVAQLTRLKGLNLVIKAQNHKCKNQNQPTNIKNHLLNLLPLYLLSPQIKSSPIVTNEIAYCCSI